MTNLMSQVITERHPKPAFLKPDLKTILCQSLQGLPELSDVVSHVVEVMA